MDSEKENKEKRSIFSYQGIDISMCEFSNMVYVNCSQVSKHFKPAISTWLRHNDMIEKYCVSKGMKKNQVVRAFMWLCEDIALAYSKEVGKEFYEWLKVKISEFKNNEVVTVKSNDMEAQNSKSISLVFNDDSGHILTNSMLVAEKFGKQHKHVIDAIKKLISSAENSAQFFVSTTYVDGSGKTNPMYVMNRDGFSLLVMGFTGEKALQFKLDFIRSFNEMEEKLRNTQPKQLTTAEMFLQIAQVNVQQEKKIAELESKVSRIEERTKANLEYSTVVAFCTRNDIAVDIKKLGAYGRKASTICKKSGIEVTKINDPRWGYVNCYPDKVLKEIFVHQSNN